MCSLAKDSLAIAQLHCDRRWAEYGLADLKLDEVNPNLFGYDMK